MTDSGETKPRRIDPATPVSELVVCTRRIISSPAGPCAPGAIVRRDDLRVEAAPEAFEPLSTRLER